MNTASAVGRRRARRRRVGGVPRRAAGRGIVSGFVTTRCCAVRGARSRFRPTIQPNSSCNFGEFPPARNPPIPTSPRRKKPPPDGGGGAERRRERYREPSLSLPQSRLRRDSPLVRGGFSPIPASPPGKKPPPDGGGGAAKPRRRERYREPSLSLPQSPTATAPSSEGASSPSPQACAEVSPKGRNFVSSRASREPGRRGRRPLHVFSAARALHIHIRTPLDAGRAACYNTPTTAWGSRQTRRLRVGTPSLTPGLRPAPDSDHADGGKCDRLFTSRCRFPAAGFVSGCG